MVESGGSVDGIEMMRFSLCRHVSYVDMVAGL